VDPEDIVTDSPDSPEEPESVDALADDADDADEGDADEGPVRSEATDELWREVDVDPVRVALPGKKLGVSEVGYTLRAYRPASQLTPTERPAEEEDPFEARERALAAEDEELGLTDEDEEETEAAEEPEEEEEEEDETEPEAEDEDQPIFLSHKGKLLLFDTPESLVSFIGSDAPHDLTQLETWPTVVKRVRASDVVPTDDDSYELDLVVENLRKGHDAWDLPLMISAGEFARDVGWALRLVPVITALSPGSPLDDLDEAARAALAGGLGGLRARRRLRRLGVSQTSTGWRTVIGKITAAVDWRD
jgi:hypothetical protein